MTEQIFKISNGEKADLRIQGFLNDTNFKDLEIICNGKSSIWCHRSILSMASPVLRSIMEYSSDQNVATLMLPEFSFGSVALFLKMCYCFDYNGDYDCHFYSELLELTKILDIKIDLTIKEEVVEDDVIKTGKDLPNVEVKRLDVKCISCNRHCNLNGRYIVNSNGRVHFKCENCQKRPQPEPPKSLLKPKLKVRCSICNGCFDEDGILGNHAPCPVCPERICDLKKHLQFHLGKVLGHHQCGLCSFKSHLRATVEMHKVWHLLRMKPSTKKFVKLKTLTMKALSETPLGKSRTALPSCKSGPSPLKLPQFCKSLLKLVDGKTVETNVCIDCNETFDSRGLLEKHAFLVHSDWMPCGDKDKNVVRPKNPFKKHVEKSYVIVSEDPDKNLTPEAKMKCHLCPLKFYPKYQQKHLQDHHVSNLPFKCRFCAYGSLYTNVVTYHEHEYHRSQNSPVTNHDVAVFVSQVRREATATSKGQEGVPGIEENDYSDIGSNLSDFTDGEEESKNTSNTGLVKQGTKYQCDKCPVLLSPYSHHRVSHLRNHHDPTLLFGCSFCQFRASKQKVINKHQTKYHSEKVPGKSSQSQQAHKHDKESDLKIKCSLCPEHFFQSYKDEHMTEHHGPNLPHKCKYCQYGSKLSDNVTLHENKFHHEGRVNDINSCGKEFQTSVKYFKNDCILSRVEKDPLEDHEKSEEEDFFKYFLSSETNSEVPTNAELERQGFTYQCDKCPLRLKPTCVDAHVRNHHDPELPLECKFCQYRAKKQLSIKFHHTKYHYEQMYGKTGQYQKAGEEYQEKMNQDLEAGVKIKCKICPQTYFPSYEPRHVAEHHMPNLPYKCKYCPYGAVFSNSVMLHENKFHYEDKYGKKKDTILCSNGCGKKYYTVKTMRNHAKYHCKLSTVKTDIILKRKSSDKWKIKHAVIKSKQRERNKKIRTFLQNISTETPKEDNRELKTTSEDFKNSKDADLVENENSETQNKLEN